VLAYLLLFVFLFFTAVLSWDGFWIGMSDLAVESTFQWSDASLVTYTNWNTFEPNDYFGRNEDCVEMRLSVST